MYLKSGSEKKFSSISYLDKKKDFDYFTCKKMLKKNQFFNKRVLFNIVFDFQLRGREKFRLFDEEHFRIQ